ncbi:type IV pilus modification protein PilV [Variovorax sp. J22P168]|uniref:type IV pilus modification protein PilV n=1 Tax=Variovorax jilinensis TaxID=3053513 RepID=UPI00257536FE|nr:type IV pilus modification protein PilV [Variovorax sp. J22P168]MDM0014130.1 type IV pilus modification protein PilV [Variovorax sp. J22P168]
MNKTQQSGMPASGQRGVAMIEVLISVLLFSLGILGLIGLQARAVSLSVDAEDRNRAALLANEIVTQMWLHKTVSLDEDITKPWEDRVKDPKTGGLPSGNPTITVTGKQADIEIKWSAPNQDGKESQLTTRVVLP